MGWFVFAVSSFLFVWACGFPRFTPCRPRALSLLSINEFFFFFLLAYQKKKKKRMGVTRGTSTFSNGIGRSTGDGKIDVVEEGCHRR